MAEGPAIHGPVMHGASVLDCNQQVRALLTKSGTNLALPVPTIMAHLDTLPNLNSRYIPVDLAWTNRVGCPP